MGSVTIQELSFARAVLAWAVRSRTPDGRIRLTYAEYNDLMRNISRRAVRVVGCEGKPQFSTYRMAQEVSRRTRRDPGSPPHTAYRCEECHHYHVGYESDEVEISLYRAARERMAIQAAAEDSDA